MIRIGTGCGTENDRVRPAGDLAKEGKLDYLVFESLAERTIALAQLRRLENPEIGYSQFLKERFEIVLKPCYEAGTKIITNMGAANPKAAGAYVRQIVNSMGYQDLKIAAITGDDCSEYIHENLDTLIDFDTNQPLKLDPKSVISANAYLGVEPIIKALEKNADIVITGRVGDPVLFMAPLIYEYNWDLNDYDMMGQAQAIGHLLECGCLVTGGLFADGVYKVVPDIAHLGLPIAEVEADGTAVITKIESSGGIVSCDTCKEQILYEIHNPKQYIQPNVIADFSSIKIKEVGPNRVKVTGGRGSGRPNKYKAVIGYQAGYIAEGEISIGGFEAGIRANLLAEAVATRIKEIPDVNVLEYRI
jgi:hypothetical protein